jgi:hypothetical protein
MQEERNRERRKEGHLLLLCLECGVVALDALTSSADVELQLLDSVLQLLATAFLLLDIRQSCSDLLIDLKILSVSLPPPLLILLLLPSVQRCEP